jgi:hypothetical protein
VFVWSAVCNGLELLEKDGIAPSCLHQLGIFSAESFIGLAQMFQSFLHSTYQQLQALVLWWIAYSLLYRAPKDWAKRKILDRQLKRLPPILTYDELKDSVREYIKSI